MKNCLCCHSENAPDAASCHACGESSWPSTYAEPGPASDAPQGEPEPVAEQPARSKRGGR